MSMNGTLLCLEEQSQNQDLDGGHLQKPPRTLY